MKSFVRRTALLVGALLVLPVAAGAQAWPTKPVKIVAPFAAGGNVDVTARIVAEQLQPLLGQPVLVENKTGAGSMIGSEAVARAGAARGQRPHDGGSHRNSRRRPCRSQLSLRSRPKFADTEHKPEQAWYGRRPDQTTIVACEATASRSSAS